MRIQTREQTPSRDLIPAILATFDLEERLDHYSAKPAGRGLYYCPFPNDRNPSLLVYQDRAGVIACRCMSTNSACPLAERKRNDVINVVAIGERVSVSEATNRLAQELRERNPQPQRTQAREQPRQPAPAPPDDTPVIDADELRRDALLKISLDSTLPTCARATYQVLDKVAGDRGICAQSVHWLELAANLTERNIQRGLRILEQRGHIRTQQRRGHTSHYILT